MTNNVAIITGSGGGIGSAIAQTLAANGMKIALLGGNNLEKLAATQAAVEKHSACLLLPGDLTDMEFLAGAVRKTAEYFGRIDTVINNAGVAQNTPFETVSIAEFDRIMAINTKVPYFLTQFALPYLRLSAAATVINIASVVAHAGYPQQSVYTASKHALLGMTKSIANELYKENIRVHAISPGGVYTDMVKISRPDLSPEGMILPEDIAEIVHFFLSHRTNAVIDEICLHRLGKEPFQI